MVETISYDMKCPICQDKRRHPLTLPCGHTFCYLCIKGVYARQRVCALCRQPIPSSCIMSPPGEEKEEEEERGKVRWYYQAKSGGWWVYEERVTLELEKSYQSLMQSELEEDKDEAKTVKEGERDKLLEIQISGFPYIVDFQRMIQYRQDKPDRIRRIKRDTAEEEEEALVRGVAGVPLAPTIKPQDDTVQ